MINPYKIYNASAGSGKTYVLAKEYLKIVLSAHGSKTYRHILAITFTNKAVNEMKQRILGSLFEFSKVTDLEKAPALFLDIQKELQIDFKTLRQRAKNTLKEILHNYSFFDVSTIDKFTHRIIRTFAKDLKLSQSFEVVLDLDVLLDEAVNRLLEKAGQDPKLTKIVLDFALEKIDDDKSWDIAFDLNKIGKLVFDENHRSHIANLKEKTIPDFLDLQKLLLEKISAAEQEIKTAASKTIHLIQENGLEFTDFTGSYFPKYLYKIHEGDFNIDFKAAWKQNFEETPLYNQKCPADTKMIIDGLFPQFITNFNRIKQGFYNRQFLKNAYGNIVPLTVLNAIQLELKALEKERDLLPISAFNSIISNEIKDQPVPFIFERLGEKYRHYFIDEFQDTSEMQWNNLMPLIGNALDTIDEYGKTGSLLLVGDPKQAIYRWRGGQAEQFLNLINYEENPFVKAPQIHLLPKNYRSHEEIIKFNNAFFTALSPFLNNGSYNELFVNGNKQEFNSLMGGLVKLSFIDDNDDEEEDELYFKNVLEIINEVLEKNYSLKDICILTRKKEHGIILAAELMQKNIPVVSSETLLLARNPEVNFLINLLHYSLDPENWSVAYEILLFLTAESPQQHRIISNNLYHLARFLGKEYRFNLDFLQQSSVYDGLEYAIRQFNLAQNASAYITFLLDTVLDIEQKEGTNTAVFLDYWEKKKGSLSVVAPENVNAVRIMTIHKSKGLEFPFVVFPYANTLIYPKQESKLWLPVEKEQYNGFAELLINKKTEVPNYNDTAEHIFYEEHQKQELDAFNLLYVAMTRAVRALYIVTQKKNTKENVTDNYSGLFIHFLKLQGLWNEDKTTYTFGNLEYNTNNAVHNQQYHIPYQTTNKERPAFKILAKSGSLWETERQDALNRGNLIHHLLSLIDTSQDMNKVFEQLLRNGDLEFKEIETLRKTLLEILTHPELKSYFEPGSIVKNEKDIITENGLILRPDRVVIQGNEATLIDFKTGKKNPLYHQQLQTYADALQAMDYQIKNKILVYINEKVTPEFI